MYAFLLVNESHLILCNAFPHLEAMSPRIYSDRLDPSRLELWCQKLPCARISCSKPHEKILSPATYSLTSSHRLLQAKLINQNIHKRLITHIILGGYSTDRAPRDVTGYLNIAHRCVRTARDNAGGALFRHMDNLPSSTAMLLGAQHNLKKLGPKSLVLKAIPVRGREGL
jgi:hypothetical protein